MPLKISRILHAGYVFECVQTRIAFDPIFENPFSHNCYAFPDVKFDVAEISKLYFDAIFISHFHDDHFSLESLNLLNRNTPIYAFCVFDELFTLLGSLGFINVYRLNIDEEVSVGSIRIIPRRALDSDVDSIFQIQACGLNVLNVVDSWIDDETMTKLSKFEWDLILWPFQTLREIEILSPKRASIAVRTLPVEWLEQLKVLNPKNIVPSSCQFINESWSWFNQALFPISYKQFEIEIRSILKHTEIVRLDPSVSILLEKGTVKSSEPLKWVTLTDKTSVDYTFDENQNPPSTAEISRRFAALNEQETQIVYDYCSVGLLQKYNSMERSPESYFKKPGIWQLSVYDHLGQAKHFSYLIDAGQMTETSSEAKTLLWTTEIPLAKFYSALKCGEALTSLYLRINDNNFTNDVELQLNGVDCMEDPLIRCLYTGVFGAYQIAQLEKIRFQLHTNSISAQNS